MAGATVGHLGVVLDYGLSTNENNQNVSSQDSVNQSLPWVLQTRASGMPTTLAYQGQGLVKRRIYEESYHRNEVAGALLRSIPSMPLQAPGFTTSRDSSMGLVEPD